jgi:hypothetical protein
MTAPHPPAAVYVAGYCLRVGRGRVWVSGGRPDPDLTPTEARALAAALTAAAHQATKQQHQERAR